MPILEKTGILISSFIETFTLLIPCVVFTRKFKIAMKKPSFRNNPPFRFLNILLMIFTVTNTFVAVLKTLSYFDNSGDLKILHSIPEHFWHFLYTIILAQITILIKMTILRADNKSAQHLRRFQYIHIIPMVLYVAVIPYKVMDCSSDTGEYILKRLGIIEKVAILLNSVYNLCITLLLTKYLWKVIKIVNGNSITRVANRKRIKEWKRFLGPVLSSGYLYVIIALGFLVSALRTKAQKEVLGEGKYKLGIKDIIIYLMKVYTSVILVLLSPYSMPRREGAGER
eukprot:GAHX01000584.1.p1 GENE.GAHX01000584.1~~GAHX01000584.1.p1  ORF type:complete len:284 (-),score=24.01 GAHX01000584.1:43-894(-)